MKSEKSYKPRKEWNWKVSIEYVPFPNEQVRRRSYELYAQSMANWYMNKQKFLQEQSKGLEKKTG